MTMISAAIAIVLVMLAWRAWRLTVIDHGRDALFDLRDGELRPRFLKGDIGQEQYEYVRTVINGMIHYLDRASYLQLWWLGKHSPKIYRIHQERRTIGGAREWSSLGQEIMRSAGLVVIRHAMLISVAGCIMTSYFLLVQQAKRIFNALMEHDSSVMGPLTAAAVSALLVFQPAVSDQRRSRSDVVRTVVEEAAHVPT